MHYANGRAAKLGDLVRGKGYNFKHEIVGLLIEAHPESKTCNCTVACVGVRKDQAPRMSAVVWFNDGKMEVGQNVPDIKADFEYGQLDAFVALDPETGEVLPPT